MLWLFGAIKDKLKPKLYGTIIDNWTFKLHYRATTIIFFTASILVTCREYIGEHIKCINDMNKPGFQRVIETYCFFTSTFTLIDQNEMDFFRYGRINYHGFLPYGIGSEQPIRRHTYYQWVPFFLFAQGIMFYMTHLLWKKFEDNRIYKFIVGLNNSRYALLDKEVEINGQNIPTREEKDKVIKQIAKNFLNNIKVNNSWARWLIFCEVLNVLHIIGQFYATDKFLGHEFRNFGSRVILNGSETLDKVFPKMTKCTFHMYGPSGSIQFHDALCIIALNVINEKIFLFVWFWFIILFTISCLNLIWRFFSIMLYSRSAAFNQCIFGTATKGKLYSWHLKMITKHCNYSDWLLLRYLSKNIDSLNFKKIFLNICEEFEEKKPFF